MQSVCLVFTRLDRLLTSGGVMAFKQVAISSIGQLQAERRQKVFRGFRACGFWAKAGAHQLMGSWQKKLDARGWSTTRLIADSGSFTSLLTMFFPYCAIMLTLQLFFNPCASCMRIDVIRTCVIIQSEAPSLTRLQLTRTAVRSLVADLAATSASTPTPPHFSLFEVEASILNRNIPV